MIFAEYVFIIFIRKEIYPTDGIKMGESTQIIKRKANNPTPTETKMGKSIKRKANNTKRNNKRNNKRNKKTPFFWLERLLLIIYMTYI